MCASDWCHRARDAASDAANHGCTGTRSHLLRTTMNRMAERVGGTFVRVRRSALVNPQAIVTVERYAKGMFVLHLRSGARLISSRYHQAAIRKMLVP